MHTYDWNIAAVDVDAYLERIDHPLVTPSADALDSLHRAHVRSIPFENVDVLIRAHRGLDLTVVSDKLVGRSRGGYCFEHATLFAAVLERLGFPVRRRIARVRPHLGGPNSHMLLTVRADGVDFQADVGFGAGVMRPMPLRHGVETDQAGWLHRLTRDDDAWTLSKHGPDGWEPLHAATDAPQRPVDYEVAHHYTSTHPRSPFTGRLVVMRLDQGVFRRLLDDELTVEHADGRIERRHVPPDELDATLRELDVVLTADELDALRSALPAPAR